MGYSFILFPVYSVGRGGSGEEGTVGEGVEKVVVVEMVL